MIHISTFTTNNKLNVGKYSVHYHTLILQVWGVSKSTITNSQNENLFMFSEFSSSLSSFICVEHASNMYTAYVIGVDMLVK